jgi:hypothetical protein
MFNTGQIYVSENVLKIAEENEIMALLERHKKLDDDTNGEDRAVNEYAINQGFGNIKNERVYFHTVKQLEGITYTRIYCRGEY